MKATVLFIALLATARGTLPLLEWHVHVYFLWTNPAHTEAAKQLNLAIVEEVRAPRQTAPLKHVCFLRTAQCVM